MGIFTVVNVLTLGVALLSLTPSAISQALNGTAYGNAIFVPNPNNADAALTIPQIIVKYGYPFEQHSVTTPDGYILTIHRIPYGRSSPPGSSPRPVVYLQHGLVSSTAQWVQNGNQGSLGFILADAGYDVWMLNLRGNTYSLGHTSYNSSDFNGPYWKFSFHENGKYDLPTAINYALANTSQTTLTYVGHSMGTTAFFIAMSLNPALNAKVNLFVALAPIVYLTNTISPLRLLAPLVKLGITQNVLVNWGPGNFNANQATLSALKTGACVTAPAADLVCANTYFLICGFDYPQFNNSQIPVYNAFYPAGTSLQTFAHYGQYINAQNFCQYNYGYVKNMLYYQSLTPPCYDLTQTTVPTALYYGVNDWLGDPTDVQILINSGLLPNVIKTKQVDYPYWNHVDFALAINVTDYLYKDVLSLIQSYTTN